MPYSSNDKLPSSVKSAIPSSEGRSLFREVVNERLDAGKSKEVAFASAWSALKRAGYEKQEGEWIKKEESYKLPKTARDNARKVLRWREEHPDEIEGMTETGWNRAKQLAENETVDAETVKAMAQFNRHRDNSKLAEEYKGKPWKDAGYVAWLGWGGDAGIDWAIRQSEKMDKRQVDDDVFTTSIEAESRSQALGYEGEIHEEQTAFGQKVYAPGESAEEYVGEKEANRGALREAVCAIIDRVMGKSDKSGYKFSVGDTVEWNSSGGKAQGKIKEIITEGEVPGIDGDVKVTGSEDDPAAQIQVLDENGEETETTVGHKLSTLSPMQKFTVTSDITKFDEEKRLVTGWASVIEENGETVVDKQGDIITEEELMKAAHKFVTDHRAAKVMHKGGEIGQVVESMVFTKDLQKQLGVDMGKVGWLITMKIEDDETWNRIKSGDFKGFSIGGKARRVQT